MPAAELLFTVEETAALFAEVGVTLPPERVRAVQADGGGWIEPTRALAYALRRAPWGPG